MSITPEGGWGEETPRQDTPQRPDSIQPAPTILPAQTTYMPRSSYLICKVCDRGSLSPKKVFHMSGPVVAIGYILLIPSILGIVFSAIMLVGINSMPGHLPRTETSEFGRPVQNTFDGEFRKSCARSVRQKNSETGYEASQQQIEQYCECALSAYKETSSETEAAQTCLQRSRDGALQKQSTDDVDAFYSDVAATPPASTTSDDLVATGVRFAGSGIAIAMGIASFVGGLLGWLLVMRKRVLKCNVCGAVVNAS
jgi:hypothetical protein